MRVRLCQKYMVLLILCVAFFPVTAFSQSLTVYDRSYDSYNPSCDVPISMNHRSVPKMSRENWKVANYYKSQRRYELAREYYLSALVHSNTAALRDTLKRELQVVELLIRTLR